MCSVNVHDEEETRQKMLFWSHQVNALAKYKIDCALHQSTQSKVTFPLTLTPIEISRALQVHGESPRCLYDVLSHMIHAGSLHTVDSASLPSMSARKGKSVVSHGVDMAASLLTTPRKLLGSALSYLSPASYRTNRDHTPTSRHSSRNQSAVKPKSRNMNAIAIHRCENDLQLIDSSALQDCAKRIVARITQNLNDCQALQEANGCASIDAIQQVFEGQWSVDELRIVMQEAVRLAAV